MTRAVALVLLVCLCACGGGSGARKGGAPALERRVVTAGAVLLEHLPAHADIVLELDVARLRRNQVVGPLVRALSPWLHARASANPIPIDLPLDADVIVAAVYDLGNADAAMLVLVRGEAIDSARVAASAPDTTPVDAHSFAFGPPAWRARTPAPAESVADDAGFAALREAAMPERAPGAVLRFTARLSGDARVAAAGRLGYDGALPAAISLWADVADDFALVALLDADDANQAQHLAADIDALVPRLGRLFRVPLALRRVRTTTSDTSVRLVWTIGPKALGDGVAKLTFGEK